MLSVGRAVTYTFAPLDTSPYDRLSIILELENCQAVTLAIINPIPEHPPVTRATRPSTPNKSVIEREDMVEFSQGILQDLHALNARVDGGRTAALSVAAPSAVLLRPLVRLSRRSPPSRFAILLPSRPQRERPKL